MIKSPLFIRIVNADRNRGFMLLVGWDAKVVQATCVQLCSLVGLTRRDQLNAAIARVTGTYTYSEVRDVTADGIKAKLRVMFGEPKPTKEGETFALALKKNGELLGYYVADDAEVVTDQKGALKYDTLVLAKTDAALCNTQWDLSDGSRFEVVSI
jgi:hypothetical protein